MRIFTQQQITHTQSFLYTVVLYFSVPFIYFSLRVSFCFYFYTNTHEQNHTKYSSNRANFSIVLKNNTKMQIHTHRQNRKERIRKVVNNREKKKILFIYLSQRAEVTKRKLLSREI